jgi:hypothetical protein
MESFCGAKCSECELYNNKCKGCINTNGCPFGKKCWIANYVDIGGLDNYELFKKELIDEINNLSVDGMSKIDNLFPLHGDFVNLEYLLPNGNNIKFLKDDEIYLGNQVECIFNDNDIKRCYGIVANTNFILVAEYGEDGTNPELIIYKKR